MNQFNSAPQIKENPAELVKLVEEIKRNFDIANSHLDELKKILDELQMTNLDGISVEEKKEEKKELNDQVEFIYNFLKEGNIDFLKLKENGEYNMTDIEVLREVTNDKFINYNKLLNDLIADKFPRTKPINDRILTSPSDTKGIPFEEIDKLQSTGHIPIVTDTIHTVEDVDKDASQATQVLPKESVASFLIVEDKKAATKDLKTAVNSIDPNLYTNVSEDLKKRINSIFEESKNLQKEIFGKEAIGNVFLNGIKEELNNLFKHKNKAFIEELKSFLNTFTMFNGESKK